MGWSTLGYVVGALGFLVTLGGIVWRAGRKRGEADQRHAYSEKVDESLEEEVKRLERRVRQIEEQEFNARLRDLRGQVERMWDYVGPAADRYLQGGGAVKLRQPDELEGGGDGD